MARSGKRSEVGLVGQEEGTREGGPRRSPGFPRRFSEGEKGPLRRAGEERSVARTLGMGVGGGILLGALAQIPRWAILAGHWTPTGGGWGPIRTAVAFNKGMAFSLFSGVEGAGTIWAGGGVVLLGIVTALLGRRIASGIWILLWGGALSNAFERWTAGRVLDYIGFWYPGGGPLFLNAADFLLILGAVGCVGSLLRREGPKPGSGS